MRYALNLLLAGPENHWRTRAWTISAFIESLTCYKVVYNGHNAMDMNEISVEEDLRVILQQVLR